MRCREHAVVQILRRLRPLSQPTTVPQSAEYGTAPSKVERGEPRELLEGERRQLTVMFCDVVGSTPSQSD